IRSQSSSFARNLYDVNLYYRANTYSRQDEDNIRDRMRKGTVRGRTPSQESIQQWRMQSENVEIVRANVCKIFM
ncbi:hypothetical protein PMAYCL1PPCAC_27244, partial [Pristionchus mayeri]